jgi:hypothetical protein
MTIREVLSARRRNLIIVGVASWLGFGLAGFWTREHGPPWLAIPFFVAFAAVVLLNFYWLRCPRCHGSVGLVNASLTGGGGWLRPRINFCPFCGTSLDDAWEKGV